MQCITIPNLPDDEWIKPHSKRVVSSLELSYKLTLTPSPYVVQYLFSSNWLGHLPG